MLIRILKFLVGLGLFALGFWGVDRLCHKATSGFRMDKIQMKLPASFTDPYALPQEKGEAILPILDQEFHYLHCGGQSYAFVSQDGQYVLKLFKFQHMRIPPWLEYIPLTGSLAESRETKRNKKLSTLKKTFNSCFLAGEKLSEETQTLYVHLAPTNYLKHKINLVDRIQIRHQIDADNTYFMIQKKGDLAYFRIQSLVEQNKIEEAKESISLLVKLMALSSQKGIRDLDPNIATNYGFQGSKAIYIDLGRFTEDPNIRDQKIFIQDTMTLSRPFKQWLDALSPELGSYLDQEIITQKFDD